MASARSLRGLDWLSFFVADVQTGFGPFVSVYLTAQKWTQVEIGFALSLGTATMMIAQVPAGALVDATGNKRRLAGLAVAAIAASALMLALWPAKLPVAVAEILHALASCVLPPMVAALSLAMVGIGGMGERIGRNARFASLGNGAAAALLGACGFYLSERAVFLLTAALVLPALVALRSIDPRDVGAVTRRAVRAQRSEPLWQVFTDRRLLVFALCAALFHLGNAAMLPLAAAEVTRRAGSEANLIIAACIVGPQLVVAAVSPLVGRLAQRWGRRRVLMIGFLAVPLRGVALALIRSPDALVVVQLLDGISAATFGVMVPLVAADLTGGSGRFNLVQGAIGLAIGLGATFSTTMAGAVFDAGGHVWGFLTLAASGLSAVLLVALALPETKPRDPGPAEVGAAEAGAPAG